MNITQTASVLEKKGIHSFRNVGWEFHAPEMISDDGLFFSFIFQKCFLSDKEYEDNKVLFVLFRNRSAFENRIEGRISDSWLSKSTFGVIAKECYDILEAQQDLVEWQIKLKESFKSML